MSIPQLKLPSTPDGLFAERDRLEGLLDASEEWRALKQLRARSGRGEKLTSVSEGQLEKLLLDSLAGNQFYARHGAVQRELDRLSGDAPDESATVIAQPEGDDLKRIRRIDANLERRLREIGVSSFQQIKDWTSEDVRRVASALTIGSRISAENWIEQAALLSALKPKSADPVREPDLVAKPTPPRPAPKIEPEAKAETEAAEAIEIAHASALEPIRAVETEAESAPDIETVSQTIETFTASPPRPFSAANFVPLTPRAEIANDAVEHMPVETAMADAAPMQDVESVEPTAPHDTTQDLEVSDPNIADATAVDPGPAWQQQINALEAQLLDIAYGPDVAPVEEPASGPLAQPAFANHARTETEIRIVRHEPPKVVQAPAAAATPPPLPPAAVKPIDQRLVGLLDREDYAAFRSSVEEATVEIVRKNGSAIPPELMQPQPAPAALPPAYPWPLEEPRDDSAPDGPKGRFTKALTGN